MLLLLPKQKALKFQGDDQISPQNRIVQSSVLPTPNSTNWCPRLLYCDTSDGNHPTCSAVPGFSNDAQRLDSQQKRNGRLPRAKGKANPFLIGRTAIWNRPLPSLVLQVMMFTSSLHREFCHRGKDGLWFKGSVQRLLIAHDIPMEFRSGLTSLRLWFLFFHNVFLFHNPKSSRKLLRVKPQPEPESTFRLGSQVCQLWASLVSVSAVLATLLCWPLIPFSFSSAKQA